MMSLIRVLRIALFAIVVFVTSSPLAVHAQDATPTA